ncbi:hypothetical protein ACFVFJ_50350, partial [Streptomyces sp. NPDC057717]|uniref:scabin-related ADP-ribosyltransferase n=1 Tax=Streptomyces sp. NPDC057717 TaxID=3346224 RepID=UPI0036BD893D
PSPKDLGMADDDFSDGAEYSGKSGEDSDIGEHLGADPSYEKPAAYEELRKKYGRKTTPKPQPAAGFGKSRYGLRPDRIYPTRSSKPMQLRYRADNEDLYRFDSRPYETIFQEGFKSRNGEVPPSLRHYLAFNKPGAFVSTTRIWDFFMDDSVVNSKKGLANRYWIKAPGGIDIVDTLQHQMFYDEHEVMFWKGIRPEFIQGVAIFDYATRKVLREVTRMEWMEVFDLASRTLNHARAIEPRITSEMRNIITNMLRDGILQGLDNRIKTEQSLTRKLERLKHENSEAPIQAIATSLTDIIRYTGEFKVENYTRRVKRACELLRDGGFSLTSHSNAWKDTHRGIHTTWYDPKSKTYFEIQFHTRGSYLATQEARELREEARRINISPQELADNIADQEKIFNKVTVPRDAASLNLQEYVSS